jgi:DNA-binding transcriptional MocR family regulator
LALDFPRLEPASDQPLVEQIAGHYRAAIQRGRLRPGDRLPTIRSVAARLNVTRTTVQEAYRRLSETGLVAATVGRGTMVLGGEASGPDSVFSPSALAVQSHQSTALYTPPLGTEVRVPLAELMPDQVLLPVEEFRVSIERVLRERGAELLVYGTPAGHPELRRVLAERRECADLACTPDEILITNGAQQGLDLVLRAFTSAGDAVAVAVPTYHQLLGLLHAHRLELVPVQTGPDGIDLEDLARVVARVPVRLLCLMPTFHNPTGRSIDRAQREEIMELLASTEIPVLEDEFQRELRFAGEPLPSLRALDRRGLTVTVRTFSKGLFPGVRTGWVQASLELLAPMIALKRATDLESSPLLQAALADFVSGGALDRHLASLRAELAGRHRAAQEALAQHMPAGSTWSRPEGGFALWYEGPPGLDGDRLADAAAARGVLVIPGRVFDPAVRSNPCLRLSLSRATPAQIREAIAVLGSCADQLLRRQDQSWRPSFL